MARAPNPTAVARQPLFFFLPRSPRREMNRRDVEQRAALPPGGRPFHYLVNFPCVSGCKQAPFLAGGGRGERGMDDEDVAPRSTRPSMYKPGRQTAGGPSNAVAVCVRVCACVLESKSAVSVGNIRCESNSGRPKVGPLSSPRPLPLPLPFPLF